jgi:hypothetical protein
MVGYVRVRVKIRAFMSVGLVVGTTVSILIRKLVIKLFKNILR